MQVVVGAPEHSGEAEGVDPDCRRRQTRDEPPTHRTSPDPVRCPDRSSVDKGIDGQFVIAWFHPTLPDTRPFPALADTRSRRVATSATLQPARIPSEPARARSRPAAGRWRRSTDLQAPRTIPGGPPFRTGIRSVSSRCPHGMTRFDDELRDRSQRSEPTAPGPPDLPAVSPDASEQPPFEIDNIVPTRGYQMMPMVGLGGSAGSIRGAARLLRRDADRFRHGLRGRPPSLADHESHPRRRCSQRATRMPVVQVENGEKARAEPRVRDPAGQAPARSTATCASCDR